MDLIMLTNMKWAGPQCILGTTEIAPINPFVRKFLGRKRPLKILPTKNLFLRIDLDSMM